MKKIALLVVVLAALAMAGCATMGNQKLDNVGNYMQLQKQQSTKLDVYRIFGQPQDVRVSKEGGAEWVYYKVHTRMSAWTFVPFVGVLAGGNVKDATYTYISFDEHGVLQDVQTKEDHGYENGLKGTVKAVSRIHDNSAAESVQMEMTSIGEPFDAEAAKKTKYLRDN